MERVDLHELARDLDLARDPAAGQGDRLAAPNGVAFALRGGDRPALRVPDPDERQELLARGGEPLHGDDSGQWVSLPDDMLDEPHQVKEWLMRAHAMALEAPAFDRDATPEERQAARRRLAQDSIARAGGRERLGSGHEAGRTR